MIYVTGDCHGGFNKFSTRNFPSQKNMNKNDTVIICGDFGGIWDSEDKQSGEEKYWLKWLNNKSFTTVFVDGNHENFERLGKFPETKWNGGRVHKVCDSVLHLMRGEVYTIEGKTFFTFGGAASHDISDGIIEPDEGGEWIRTAKIWKKLGRKFRVKGKSWWEEELPSDVELEHALETLSKYEYHVDYMITHCCPQHIVERYIGREDKADILTLFFDEIDSKVNYEKWFFGHYHDNQEFEGKYILLYDEILHLL